MIWVHGGRGFCPHSHLCSILYIGEILHNRALICAEMIAIKKYYTWFHARSLPKRRNLMKMQLFCKNHPYPCVIQKELHGKLHRRGDRLCNDFQMRGILHTRVGFEPAGNACYHKPTTHQVAPRQIIFDRTNTQRMHPDQPLTPVGTACRRRSSSNANNGCL